MPLPNFIKKAFLTAAQLNTMNAQIDANLQSSVPAGSMMSFAGSSAPNFWLLCDGSSYDTVIYAVLFDVIGYTYGGSGSNFNVPDTRGKYITGIPAAGTLGSSIGTPLSDEENRPVGQHNHAITDPGHVHGGGAQSSGTLSPGFSSFMSVVNTLSAVTLITVDNEGSVIGTNAPYIQTNWIIKI